MSSSLRLLRLAGPAALAAALLGPAARLAGADLVPQDGAFGAGTLTLDTASGLRWLDLPLSTNHSYAQILAELESGGLFEGFRLADGSEVTALWEHVGIDTGTGLWIAANYAPIVTLAALVGMTSNSGNCGSGCTFFETKGWIDNGDPPASFSFLSAANVRWFDNDPPQTTSPSYPQDEIGSALFSTHSDSASAMRGAWLVEAPEPIASAIGAVAGATLAAIALRGARRAGPRLGA
jgi:hypothetical protein